MSSELFLILFTGYYFLILPVVEYALKHPAHLPDCFAQLYLSLAPASVNHRTGPEPSDFLLAPCKASRLLLSFHTFRL